MSGHFIFAWLPLSQQQPGHGMTCKRIKRSSTMVAAKPSAQKCIGNSLHVRAFCAWLATAANAATRVRHDLQMRGSNIFTGRNLAENPDKT
jgi:hypothetical protein